MALDQAGLNGLGHYLLELSHRDSVEARDVIRATPRVGGLSHEVVQRDDEPADEAWMRRHGVTVTPAGQQTPAPAP